MPSVLSRQELGGELRRNVRIRSLDVGPRGQTTAFSIECQSNHPVTKTILVVDDEESIRSPLCQSLQRCGYRLLEAGSGPDALALTSSSAQAIDVLVSDVMMPGMSGLQLARELCATRPHLKVILISGFTDSPPSLERGWEFLAKPFPPSALRAKLSQLSDTAPVP